jgi:hypothetical protein
MSDLDVRPLYKSLGRALDGSAVPYDEVCYAISEHIHPVSVVRLRDVPLVFHFAHWWQASRLTV